MAEGPVFDRQQVAGLIEQLRTNIEQLIFGQEQLVTEALVCLFAGGHLLITGAPGLAKTTLVRVLAQFSGLQFGRVQFTPDLLPSDITGSDILNIDAETNKRSFEFASGPIFTNLLLADEINRASPRTQSALLEAMQERAVTVGGKRFPLPKPFMVFATQNPYESEGTFVLPEAQLDRFLLHSLIEYPDAKAERRVFSEHAGNRLVGETSHHSTAGIQVIGVAQILGLMQASNDIQTSEEMIDVISEIVRATRPHESSCPEALRRAIWYGAGTRAGIALVSAAKAHALIQGREGVRWDDIRLMAKPVLRHRMKMSVAAVREQMTSDRAVDVILDRIGGKYLTAVGG